MRKWLETLDDIDFDCVEQYEMLLGRELKSRDEYTEIDRQVDEMILEWENRAEFFENYPNLLKYASDAVVSEVNELKENSEKNIPLWMRLGVSIKVTSEELKILTQADESSQKLLMALMQSGRGHINGDTYFPAEGSPKYLMEDVDFNLPDVPLTVSPENSNNIINSSMFTKREIEVIKKALDFTGDKVADREGYSSGIEYWDIKDKLDNLEIGSTGPKSLSSMVQAAEDKVAGKITSTMPKEPERE